LKSWLLGVEKERKRTSESKKAKKQASERGGREQKRQNYIGKELEREEGGEKQREDAKLIDNFSHESDVTSLKTPF